MIRLVAFAASASLVLMAPAVSARELRPLEAYSVHLGDVIGTVYFDKVGADDRLVATLSSAPGAKPVRVIATLAPGQSTTVSVPRGVDEAALDVTFTRRGDAVFVIDSDLFAGAVR